MVSAAPPAKASGDRVTASTPDLSAVEQTYLRLRGAAIIAYLTTLKHTHKARRFPHKLKRTSSSEYAC